MKVDTTRKYSSPGFSQLALMLVVAVIGILGGVGVISIGHILSSAKNAKLNSDMVALNSAVRSYQLFGGKFEGTESADSVLIKLRSRANDETADHPDYLELVGKLTGSPIKFSNGNTTVSANNVVLHPGTNSLTLRTMETSRSGEITNVATMDPKHPQLAPIVHSTTIDLP